MDEREQLIELILKLDNKMIPNLAPAKPAPWLELDLTMPQMKTMMLVTYHKGTTVGALAKNIGVGLSTVTGIVDRLCEQGLVTRSEDPNDRRVTRVIPTERAYQQMESLQRSGRDQWRRFLNRMSLEELQTVERAIEYVYRAALAEMNEQQSKDS